jgi:hypothetical protein
MQDNSKYKIISLFLLLLLTVNPISLYLLFHSLYIAFALPTIIMLISFILFKRTKFGHIYFYYIVFLFSLLYHSELVFNINFQNLIIKNLYSIKDGFYFNKPFLKEEIQDKEFNVDYYTNSQGYRISTKTDNNTLIEKCDWLFIGDSYVQGAQVNYEQLFTTELYKYFPDKIILNTGISGLGIIDEYLLYKNLAKKYIPEKVFLVICNFNDFMNVTENRLSYSDYLIDKSNFLRYILFDYKYANPQSLPLGRWTEPFYMDEKDNIDFNVFYKSTSDNKIKDIANFKKYLKLFNSEVIKNKSELVIIHIPTKEQVYYKYFDEVINSFKIDVANLDMNFPNDLLQNACKENGIKLIDLREPFAKSEFEVYFQFDEHLNQFGHQCIANEIFNKFNPLSEKYKLLTNGNTYDRYPTYDLSSNQITYQSLIDGNFEIISTDTNFSVLNRITFNEENEIHPVFKKGIYMFSQGDQEIGNLKVHQLDIVNGIRKSISEDSLYGGIPQFSHKNLNLITFAEWNNKQNSKSKIILQNTKTKEKRIISPANNENWRPIFSPNDSIIYYISKSSTYFSIYSYDIIKKTTQILFKDNYDIWDIAISPDGKVIAFAGNPDTNWDLFILNIETKKIKRLTLSKGNEWDPFFLNNNTLLFAGVFGFNFGIYSIKIN